jgi:hypothetical protein
MEQMISGQIGQPAACMIENKRSPSATKRQKSASEKHLRQNSAQALRGFGAARLWARRGAISELQTRLAITVCDPGDGDLRDATPTIHRCCGQLCV